MKTLPKEVTQSLVDHWVMLCREHDLGEPSLAYTVHQEGGGVVLQAIELPINAVISGGEASEAQVPVKEKAELAVEVSDFSDNRKLFFDDSTGEVRIEKASTDTPI